MGKACIWFGGVAIALFIGYAAVPPTTASWVIGVLWWGFIVAGVLFFLTGLIHLILIARRRQKSGAKRIVEANSIKIEVSQCSLEEVETRPFEILTLIVELTVQVTTIPIEMASLQLCIGTDTIDPISPELPVTIANSPASYIVKYEVSMPTIIMASERKDMGHICIFALGQKWLSNEFQIPYDSPLLPQEFNPIVNSE